MPTGGSVRVLWHYLWSNYNLNWQYLHKFSNGICQHTAGLEKKYSFLDPVHTTPFWNENDTALFRIRLPSTLQRWKRSPKTDRFENALQSGTIWKRYCLKTLFPSVDGESDAIWKQWRHHNNTTWLQTTQPWVSKISDRRFLVDSLLIALISSLLTLLKAHLLFDFSRREQDIIKLLSLPALGGTMIIKTTRSKSAKT